MRRALWIGLFLSCQAGAQNLLVNPGFEEQSGGMPVDWYVFVQPMEGAKGALEYVDATRGHAVVLHNPEIYEREPYNNWVQNIMARLGEHRLRVRGLIKTEEAVEAAIWVQAFQREPFRELQRTSTSPAAPVYGTRDWTRVDMEVAVPKDTDYVAVRCILRGLGTAWFDDLEVVDLSAEEARAKVARPAPPEKPERPGVEPVTPLSETGTRAGDAAPPRRTEQPSATEVHRVGPEAMESLIEANRAMAEAVRSLRETNTLLSEQLREVQEELHAVRADLRALEGNLDGATDVSAGSGAAASAVMPRPVLPFVERGEEDSAVEPSNGREGARE